MRIRAPGVTRCGWVCTVFDWVRLFSHICLGDAWSDRTSASGCAIVAGGGCVSRYRSTVLPSRHSHYCLASMPADL